ncbi:MAG: F0F1 ATP synthase subunit A [Naasia sp.]
MENELLNAVLTLVPRAEDGEGFHAPTLAEFFPPVILFEGTPFEINRIIMVRLIAVALLILLLWLGTRRMKVVPGRGQSIVEMLFGFVRTTIGEEILGRKDGKRFLPLLTTIFFLVLATNITGVIPGLNIAGSSLIGLPLVLAVVAYVAFIYAGIKDRGAAFFKTALFPPGVPKPLYILLTPIELLSTFILRPISLTLRLLMNMVVGHLLLVLCFAATDFFFFNASVDGPLRLIGAGTLGFGIFFTLFEILVAVLQAYIFTLLTAVYIQLAVAEEH